MFQTRLFQMESDNLVDSTLNKFTAQLSDSHRSKDQNDRLAVAKNVVELILDLNMEQLSRVRSVLQSSIDLVRAVFQTHEHKRRYHSNMIVFI